MYATNVWRRVVWQVLGDMIGLGWVIGRGEKVVITVISGYIEKRQVVGWLALAELMK
jgi:hypothetical protein